MRPDDISPRLSREHYQPTCVIEFMMRKPFILATVFLVSMAGPVLAQATTGTVPSGGSTSGLPKAAVPAPNADPGMATQPAPGVLRPPATDPGMMVPPPHAGAATIIPPPGTAGGNPAIIPK